MFVIEDRNVHRIIPRAAEVIRAIGVERASRNGPVLVSPTPVTTVYQKPCERVVFWEQRDANPFFHLYESLWMLAGFNEISSLVRYAKNIANYSDDGFTMHGAYGHRWRKHFTIDQLKIIAEQLQKNKDDRRAILQMWDCPADLGRTGKDVPCNTIASFQVNTEGALDLTVFCRSNDIIWGAYGANAVHFSVLLEYMAAWISVPVGRFYQVSVNWHAYLATLKLFDGIPNLAFGDQQGGVMECEIHGNELVPKQVDDPYTKGEVIPVRLVRGERGVELFDKELLNLLYEEDRQIFMTRGYHNDSLNIACQLFRAHQAYKSKAWVAALDILNEDHAASDWIVAAKQWIWRRMEKQASGN